MIRVRSARPDDAAAWWRLRCALWPDGPEAEHRAEIAQFFGGRVAMPLEVLLAVDDTDVPLGVVELSIRPYAEECVTDRVAYLEGWYVVPEARRRGVGRALVAAAEQWALSRGCSEFASDSLIDNTVGAAAHRSVGFIETARIRCFRKVLRVPAVSPRAP